MFGEPSAPAPRSDRGEHADLCRSRAARCVSPVSPVTRSSLEGTTCRSSSPTFSPDGAGRASTRADRRASARAESPPSSRARFESASDRRRPAADRSGGTALDRRRSDRHARPREQHVEQVADGDRPARADVVRAAGLAALERSAGRRARCRARRSDRGARRDCRPESPAASGPPRCRRCAGRTPTRRTTDPAAARSG